MDVYVSVMLVLIGFFKQKKNKKYTMPQNTNKKINKLCLKKVQLHKII